MCFGTPKESLNFYIYSFHFPIFVILRITMSELFKGMKLFSADGAEQPAKSLEGKLVGLYFSAQWCPSCRDFTPILAQFYRNLRRDNHPFEVVFISRDRSYEVLPCSLLFRMCVAAAELSFFNSLS